jgi:hypothetical protein
LNKSSVPGNERYNQAKKKRENIRRIENFIMGRKSSFIPRMKKYADNGKRTSARIAATTHETPRRSRTSE